MCDTLCHQGVGGALFAKSSDRPLGEAQVVEAFAPRPPGGSLHTQYLTLHDPGAVALVGSRPTWLWGLEHGVNIHRVAIGNERVWTTDDPEAQPDALIGMDLVRLGLERATTAERAVEIIVELLERHGQGGIADATFAEAYFSSFLVVDPTEGWVLETSARSWAARRVARGSGAAISNRLGLGTDWDRASADVAPGEAFTDRLPADLETGHALVRLETTLPLARAGGTLAEAAATMRSHGTGPPQRGGSAARPGLAALPGPAVDLDGTGVSVCMHVRGYQVTAASMLAELPVDPARPMAIRAALGSPCASVYVPVVLAGAPHDPVVAVPDVLGDPDAWAAFEAIARQVEAVHDAAGPDAGSEVLTAVREVLDATEAELWAQAAVIEEGAGERAGERTGAEPAAVRRLVTDADRAVRGAIAAASATLADLTSS